MQAGIQILSMLVDMCLLDSGLRDQNPERVQEVLDETPKAVLECRNDDDFARGLLFGQTL
ncbi:MAG: hypothetical protein BMS9Abin36_1134 [Gammaproteobacteria bacterium]|nr:MAG: hypothetical protein BMS9Abin36_1134 [Gammaproteobacteria bacterium]